MQYVRLGRSGLEVSRICLGCATFGASSDGPPTWILDEEHARPLIRKARELGINFFDTANVYSSGSSEEIVGRALKEFASRDEVVIATKVHGRMRPGPNGGALSRKAIFAEIDHSLRRLGTDYVDLYQIHRWDDGTPIEETMEALHDVVKAGKARYIGASSMYAWQFAKSLYLADMNGWTRFIAMQNHYNLLYRDEEREMIPLCQSEQIGILPWSPLARGRLSRPWGDPPATTRAATDSFGDDLYSPIEPIARTVVSRVVEVSSARGVGPTCVALAWHFSKPYVTAPIIGVTKPRHFDDVVQSLNLQLTDEEIRRLEEPYPLSRPLGFD